MCSDSGEIITEFEKGVDEDLNLYTIVTADQYELPVKCDVRVHEAASFLGVPHSYIHQLVFHGRAKNGYKVIISGKTTVDGKEYSKRYGMTHDRSEYFKAYYRRKKDGTGNIQRIQT